MTFKPRVLIADVQLMAGSLLQQTERGFIAMNEAPK